jgi:CHAT domain-containing protein/tetratricopeptide (TPR) repeat protein
MARGIFSHPFETLLLGFSLTLSSKIYSKMTRILLCVALVLGLAVQLQAQIRLNELKKAAVDVGKNLNTKENRDRALTIGQNRLAKVRAKFDSTDFDYAVLTSDNSGLIDVKERGERLVNGTSFVSDKINWLNDKDLEPSEKAKSMLQDGEVLYGLRFYKQAEDQFNETKQYYEQQQLTDELGYIKTISNQGLLYATMGRFTQAEGFTSDALDLRKAKFGDASPGIGASLNNYAVLKYSQARYNEAEKDFEDALAILKTNNMQGTMPHAIVLNNQAMLFQAIGRYEEAVPGLKEACAIGDKLKSAISTNHLKFLSNLALLYQQMGKFADAEAIYLGMEKRLGKNNPDYASMLSNQAALYIIMGKEDKVEDLLKKSAAIYKSNFGEENPAYAKAISDLGNFYRYKEKYAEADPLLERALAIRELTLGRNHPMYVQSQEDIAILSWKRKAWSKAFMMYREVMDKSLDFVNKYFPPMSEAEKTKYWDVLSPRFHRFYNFAIEANIENPAVVQDLYDYHIATKALLLNSTNRVKQAIFSSKDAQLIKDYVTWLDQKETLARLYAYSKEELRSQKINLDSMVRAANSMEKKLSERSGDFSSGYSSQKLSYKDIRGVLNDAEAVVEIVQVQTFTQKFTEESRYVALILTKTAEMPKLVILENGQQLDTRYFKYYRNAIQQKLNDEYSYDQFWGRVDPELGGKKILYTSLDGVYNQINLNTLRKPGAEYVVNKYEITILGNSKDLVALKKQKPKTTKKSATLIGFPEYGTGEIAALPGTKVEVESISKVLKTSGYQVNQFMQKNATEANLKSIKGPSVIHIATHGYFLKDVESTGSAFGVHIENANDNPLLRSGLLLAGASSTVSGKRMPNLESNDNGILTAYEAMNLNLEATDMIVVSACETGLGDVKSGEGVYGLQRAFLVAGADAIVMSLWKVDDAATQQLMTNFYTNWLKLGNKQKAFKQAQLQLMTKYKEPYYWGAFVMMGH